MKKLECIPRLQMIWSKWSKFILWKNHFLASLNWCVFFIEWDSYFVKWNHLNTYSDMDRERMTLALQISCAFGNKNCLSKSSQKFTSYPAEPDRDQKLTTYCYGIQEGTKSQWETMWERYKIEINPNELYRKSFQKFLFCRKILESVRLLKNH